METSYDELRRKETVNLSDGKRLGRVTDVVFTFPEGRVQGIVVPGSGGFRFGKSKLFIELSAIKKIGIDVILVDIKCAPKPKKKSKWDDDYCCPPPPPPPPPHQTPPMPRPYGADRRDYGEYE